MEFNINNKEGERSQLKVMSHFLIPPRWERGKVDPSRGCVRSSLGVPHARAQTRANGTECTQRHMYSVSVAFGPSKRSYARATRGVGWFHLSQSIEVSIAAAMLHTKPLPTAPPCCIHFTSSPLSTARTWILERDIHVQTVNELGRALSRSPHRSF